MLRQRLRARTSRLVVLARVLVLLLALLLVWYGLMLVLLAVKVAPHTVNDISGYRTAFDYLAGLTPDDVAGGVTRPIIAGAGVLVFLVCGWLASKEIPRPYLARHALELSDEPGGAVSVEARAVERAAEIAACGAPGVTSAAGRFATDAVELGVTVSRATGLPDVLHEVQRRVREALGTHGLPVVPVHVTLTGFDRRTRRELS